MFIYLIWLYNALLDRKNFSDECSVLLYYGSRQYDSFPGYLTPFPPFLPPLPDVVPEDVLPSDKREAVDRMAKFITIFHAPYFLQAFLPAAAPRLDLQYWKDMIEF